MLSLIPQSFLNYGVAAGQSTTSKINHKSIRRATTENNSTVAGLGFMKGKARAPQRRHRLPRTIDISSILDSLEGARFGRSLRATFRPQTTTRSSRCGEHQSSSQHSDPRLVSRQTTCFSSLIRRYVCPSASLRARACQKALSLEACSARLDQPSTVSS